MRWFGVLASFVMFLIIATGKGKVIYFHFAKKGISKLIEMPYTIQNQVSKSYFFNKIVRLSFKERMRHFPHPPVSCVQVL